SRAARVGKSLSRTSVRIGIRDSDSCQPATPWAGRDADTNAVSSRRVRASSRGGEYRVPHRVSQGEKIATRFLDSWNPGATTKEIINARPNSHSGTHTPARIRISTDIFAPTDVLPWTVFT